MKEHRKSIQSFLGLLLTLSCMSGLQVHAHTTPKLLLHVYVDGMEGTYADDAEYKVRIKKNQPRNGSQNLIFTVRPFVRFKVYFVQNNNHKYIHNTTIHAPCIGNCVWYIPSTEGSIINKPISIKSLVASYTYAQRIRPPVATKSVL